MVVGSVEVMEKPEHANVSIVSGADLHLLSGVENRLQIEQHVGLS